MESLRIVDRRWIVLLPSWFVGIWLVACTGDLEPIDFDPHEPASPFLQDPDLAVGFVAESADFWIAARDVQNGGFFSFVEADGTASDDSRKSLVGQSRNAYGFAKAFMLSGDEAYLDHAEHALEFLVAHGWDAEHGGWAFTVDEYGDLVPFADDWDPNTYRWSFVQHYALLGFAAVCEATRSEEACGWLEQGRELLDERMWDPDDERFGYYDEADLDWSEPTGKGFTPTVDAVTTHALAGFLLDGDEEARVRLLQLADNMSEHLAGNAGASGVASGFPEVYDSSWAIVHDQTASQPGHVLKTAWCLLRAHAADPTAGYLADAQLLIRDTLDHGGYDAVHGGPFHEVDWATGQVTSRDKVYWVLEQGVTAGLLAHHHAAEGDTSALQMADESLDFYMTHLVDPAHGETWSQTSEDGSLVTVEAKGDAFKAAYHSIELGYYTYLYGNLLLQDRPVTLHYSFEASADPFDLPLTPLALPDGTLVIDSVTLDGQPHDAFVAETPSLHVPGNTTGTFAVTFSAP